jgi:hypothetical protein
MEPFITDANYSGNRGTYVKKSDLTDQNGNPSGTRVIISVPLNFNANVINT